MTFQFPNTTDPRGMTRVQKRAFHALRQRIGRLRGSSYDVSNTCNLTCEGCLYFASEAALPREAADTDHAWAELFRREAARGVNFAYLAGAEPALVPQRLRAAQAHIPAGVIFTNGTRRIADDIRFRIHVSLWGLDDNSGRLRGADVNDKAFSNFRDDPRAVFVFTINAQNTDEIVEVAHRCAEAGVILTYSYFSPTETYNAFLASGGGRKSDYLRLGRSDYDPRHTPHSLARARAGIVKAMQLYPGTVRYSLHYNDWISQPAEALWDLDADGVAINCGNRLTTTHRHYAADASLHEGKCCSPNLDCRQCRAYAMGFGTYLTRHREFAKTPQDFAAWHEGWQIWADLFMPLAPAPDAVAVAAENRPGGGEPV